MFKQPYEFVSIQLDRLFFLPFAPNETVEMRSIAIEAMLQASGWTWDEVLNEIAKPEGN
jgi:hypothetical protein